MNIEYRHETGFERFYRYAAGKKIAMVCDKNTQPFKEDLKKELSLYAETNDVFFNDTELVPTEDKCEFLFNKSKKSDYILAVGSGTLCDMAKSVSFRLGIPCGVFATAASMDGYCSKGAALMRNGIKITEDVKTPSDILIDLSVVCNAPKIMTAAGFGDIIGKYTSLADWKTANAVKGEPISEKAFSMMQNALDDCVSGFEELTKYGSSAVARLMNALITAGLAMAECGNSRPASGSEHHISHFLEMDFLRRREKIPMHGIKVAIGTLVSMEIYNFIKNSGLRFDGYEKVYRYTDELPPVEKVKSMLVKMGCPVRFSEIGVKKETFFNVVDKAYAVRNRYTVLTLAHELDITERLKPLLFKKYY